MNEDGYVEVVKRVHEALDDYAYVELVRKVRAMARDVKYAGARREQLLILASRLEEVDRERKRLAALAKRIGVAGL